MISQLEVLLDNFPGPANQTRCFHHILSITAKSIIKKFDILKAKNRELVNLEAQALADIADVLEAEEQEEYEKQEQEDDEEDDQPLDPWVDFQEGWTDKEREEIWLRTQPVCLMLTKVCHNIPPP